MLTESLDDPGSYLRLFQLAGFFLLFPFSILFSAAETAFMSFNSNEIKRLKESEKLKDRKIAKLLSENSDSLLITLLLGNTFVNVAIPTLATHLMYSFSETLGFSKDTGFLLVIIVVTILIFLIGEIIPKSFAIKNRYGFASKTFSLIQFFYAIFYPLTFIIEAGLRILSSRNKKLIPAADIMTKDDVQNLMEYGGEEGVLEEDEKQMINSIFEFGDTSAKEIMVPRVDMKAVEDDVTFNELLEFLRDNSFSRIPVYNESIDNIIGILYLKDLLTYLDKKNEEIDISELVREVTFIPESKDIGDLLKQFQKEKIHIAIVVDEYGGTAGMITLEDIIEEIVGEIQDEYDKDEHLYKKISPFAFEFDAKIDIEEASELLGVDLPEEDDYESLGGFLYYLYGEIPEEGDKKIYENLIFTILSTDKQRIGWVRVEVQEKETIDEDRSNKD